MFLRSVYMRYVRFKLGLTGIGKGCWVIKKQRYIAKDLVLGDHSFIGVDCTIYPKVTIGKFALLAPNVSIIGADHRYNLLGTPICFSGREELKNTSIGNDVWIGQNAIIMAGINIGSGAIIAAGSVVTKDVPECVIVGGNPAKFIRDRFNDSSKNEMHLLAISSLTEAGEYTKDLL